MPFFKNPNLERDQTISRHQPGQKTMTPSATFRISQRNYQNQVILGTEGNINYQKCTITQMPGYKP